MLCRNFISFGDTMRNVCTPFVIFFYNSSFKSTNSESIFSLSWLVSFTFESWASRVLLYERINKKQRMESMKQKKIPISEGNFPEVVLLFQLSFFFAVSMFVFFIFTI